MARATVRAGDGSTPAHFDDGTLVEEEEGLTLARQLHMAAPHDLAVVDLLDGRRQGGADVQPEDVALERDDAARRIGHHLTHLLKVKVGVS